MCDLCGLCECLVSNCDLWWLYPACCCCPRQGYKCETIPSSVCFSNVRCSLHSGCKLWGLEKVFQDYENRFPCVRTGLSVHFGVSSVNQITFRGIFCFYQSVEAGSLFAVASLEYFTWASPCKSTTVQRKNMSVRSGFPGISPLLQELPPPLPPILRPHPHHPCYSISDKVSTINLGI